jgi:hypothetical protein
MEQIQIVKHHRSVGPLDTWEQILRQNFLSCFALCKASLDCEKFESENLLPR